MATDRFAARATVGERASSKDPRYDAERRAPGKCSMEPDEVAAARVAQYELQISIRASQERVWHSLVNQITGWWLPDFQMLGSDSLVTLEPHAGGRLFEKNGERELLWYTVLAIMPHESLSLVGYCTPDFGGPLTTMLTVKLAETPANHTELTITDALLGHVTDQQMASLRSGWTQLFAEGLKPFAEQS